MQRLKSLSIQQKLVALIIGTNAAVLLMVLAVSALLQVQQSKRKLEDDVVTLAHLISRNSRAAVAFGDHRGATKLLETILPTAPHITRAALYGGEGAVLATTRRGHRPAFRENLPISDGDGRVTWNEGYLEIVVPVGLERETVGTLFLESDNGPVYKQLGSFLLTTFLIFSSGLMFAVFLARRLQRVISRPILNLATTARRISIEGDYSVRAEASGHTDEIGELITTFNSMLAQIEERDRTLVSATQRAQEADRAKSNFLANMSHELRTPMNAIMNMTRMTMESPLTEEQRENLHTVEIAADSLLDTIDDILDISRIESGTLVLSESIIDVTAFLDDLHRVVKVRSDQNGTALIFDVAPTVPLYIKTDAGKLRQVLLNLLSNAVKFVGSDGVVVLRVDGQQNGERKSRISFTVIDTGIGISPEHQEIIFDPFTQVDSSGTRKYGGSGLGLSICKKLAHLFKGDIIVRSRPQVGSAFVFSAPFQVEQESEGISDLSHPSLASNAALQILVVEDNPINQKVVVRMLEREGHRIALAENGQVALDKFRNGKYDVILMDCQMPVMDGLDATRHIRLLENGVNGASHRVPIIAVTAHAMVGDREVCMAAGMDDYVTKPVSKNSLIAAINKAVNRRLSGAYDVRPD